MKRHSGCKISLFLAIFLSGMMAINCQVPADIPPEWLVPIGAGAADGATGNPAVAEGGADPAAGTNTPAAIAEDSNPFFPIGGAQPAVEANPGNNAGVADAGTTPAADPGAAVTNPAAVPLPTEATPATTPATNPATPAEIVTNPANLVPTEASPAANEQQPDETPALPETTPTEPANPEPETNEPSEESKPAPSQVPVDQDERSDKEEEADGAPPGPPLDWQALPLDKTIIFGMEIRGPSLVPWTKPKSWVFVNVLNDPFLKSANIKREDIEAGVVDSYRSQVPTSGRKESAGESTEMQTGVQMRVTVNTNSIRVESEVESVIQAVNSGELAESLSMALGTPVENITLITDPQIVPYDSVPDPNESTGGDLPGWIIGAIVGGILILIPIPAYILYKRNKRKHLEALTRQQAEAAAARQRMQSRIIKAGGHASFTAQRDLKVMNGSENGEIYPQGLYTPGSMIERDHSKQSSGNWGNPGESPAIEHQRSNSSLVNPYTPGRSVSPSRSFLSQQQQRTLYQQNSLGPGGMPPVSRVNSYSHGRHASGSVYPVRYSDGESPSNSSGDLSDRSRKV
eukprot:jgi/Picsp_1/3440/NSC_06278-R1_expressed protein [Chlorella variabilis]